MADYSDYKECTDCVHYELCLHQEKFLIEHNRKDLIRRYGFGLSEPEICCNFRDRSRFVELPCKVGDVIFCTTMGKIYQGVVGKIELGDEGFDITTVDGYCFDSSICYHTQKEAEQALKERKANENS